MILQTPIQVPVITGISNRNPNEAPAVFAKIFSSIIGILLVGASIWAFVQLLLGGINWISSGGDKSKLENAQHQLTNALIGLFIVFASWAIYVVILQLLGLSGPGPGINIKLPTLF